MAEAKRGEAGGWSAVLTAGEARAVDAVIVRWAATVPADGPSAPVQLRNLQRTLREVADLDRRDPAQPPRSGSDLPHRAVTAADVAERLAVEVADVPKLIRAGELLGEHHKGRGWLVLDVSVDAYERRRRRRR